MADSMRIRRMGYMYSKVARLLREGWQAPPACGRARPAWLCPFAGAFPSLPPHTSAVPPPLLQVMEEGAVLVRGARARGLGPRRARGPRKRPRVLSRAVPLAAPPPPQRNLYSAPPPLFTCPPPSFPLTPFALSIPPPPKTLKGPHCAAETQFFSFSMVFQVPPHEKTFATACSEWNRDAANCTIPRRRQRHLGAYGYICLMALSVNVYCFRPKPDEIIKWYKEIEAVLNMHQGGILSKTTSSKSSSSANSSSVSSSSANNASANNASGTASSSNDTSSANASSSANMPYYTGNPDFVADEFSGGEGDDEDAAYDDGRFSHDSRDLTSTMAGTVSGADEEDVGRRFMHGAAQTQRVGTLLHARAMAHGHLGSKTRKKNNRLRRGLKKGLAKSVKSLVSLYREADAWQLLGVENGIRVCLLKPSVAYEMGLAFPTPLDISKAADREVTAKNIAKREKTGKGLSKYGLQPVLRGVCVIKAPPSAVSRLIMDVRERKHWDPHFSVAEEVDSCFPRTQLVRLRGACVAQKLCQCPERVSRRLSNRRSRKS